MFMKGMCVKRGGKQLLFRHVEGEGASNPEGSCVGRGSFI